MRYNQLHCLQVLILSAATISRGNIRLVNIDGESRGYDVDKEPVKREDPLLGK